MRIREVILQTSKLQELVSFYSETLELPVFTNNSEITIQIGSTKLVFQQAGTADPFYHFAINVPANKIEEAREWVNKRIELIWIDQYQSDIANFVNWNAKSVYFFDPAGNILELIARFDLDNKTGEAFSSVHFISISEIALVVKEDKLAKKVNDLLQDYRLSYFAKQPPTPHFVALGDDDGLFIIVQEKRNWFPTNIPSGIYPIKIVFENNGKDYRLKLVG
jgi:catechol-2,3-dioxygenase